ncbi:MAG: catalase [Desulfovibrio sp.]|jgi:hypothetical protein|nr:catalase [Desulfovibrio sp.]
MTESLRSVETRIVPLLNAKSAQETHLIDDGARQYENMSSGSFARQTSIAPTGFTAQPAATNNLSNTTQAADQLHLSLDAQQQLRELRQRDTEVRAHEQAHLSAAGAHAAGGANYVYQKGPDGRQYAVGGHVNIDVSSVPGNPAATREKAKQVRRAALAPGEPSSQDQQIAVKAAALEAEARQRIHEQEQDNLSRARHTDKNANPDGQTRLRQQALDAYQVTAAQISVPTALAPYGTGISLTA